MSGHTSPLSFLPLGATLAQAPTTGSAAAADAGPPLAPVVLMILCAAAGVATVMLLPSRREAPLRKIGGVALLAVGLIFAALLVRWTAGSAGGGGMGAYFWIFSAIALVGALRVITHTKPVYSALYFVLTVFATAGLFLLLWAEFMAVALVLIYAGAILVTYVFVIMLAAEAASPGAGVHRVSETDAVSREPVLASAVGYLLMGVILFVIFDKASDLPRASATNSDVTPALYAMLATQDTTSEVFTAPTTQPTKWEFPSSASVTPRVEGATQQLGAYLFRNQLVNLELAGLILTVAMVGALVIARKRVIVAPADDFGMPARATADVVHGPATPIDDDPHSIPVYGTLNPRQKEYPET
jgi:NADH-quinone oxidoreductase subunit J